MTEEKQEQSNETISILERAEKLHKETLESEERIKQHRKAIEEIETRRVMGGGSTGGSIQKTAEELQKEQADAMAQDIVNAFTRRR